MRIFREKAASVTVRNISYIMELVFVGPMTPVVFSQLYAKALQFVDGGPLLCDVRGMVPLGAGADFVGRASDYPCAVVASEANAEAAQAYSIAAAKSGDVKAIYFDYGEALRWVVRRRLQGLKYPAPASVVDCD